MAFLSKVVLLCAVTTVFSDDGLFSPCSSTAPTKSLFEYKSTLLNGEAKDFNDYAGHVTIAANLASF